ncbi:MAG TPA: exo-alpha-sialidase [Bryobacteraceae bacterium]|nr:exo-alpha-sialidase [Bryobacteraceae bacterium]
MPGRGLFAVLLTCLSSVSPASGQQADNYRNAQIVWDRSTLHLIQPGGVYGRMVRLPNREILCAFEWGGAISVRRSADEGSTWSAPVVAASYRFGNAANPELLVLANGSVLLSYNERPADGIHAYTIRVAFSRDNGQTWGEHRTVFTAGRTSETGCWEPAQIQLPSGEIDLYFSNEQPYPATSEQEISLSRSFDDGATWSSPERVSFRPGHRDGMPVPLALRDGSGVVLSIEDNGLAGAFKPAIVPPESGTRWAALETQLPAKVYAGAPYLRQFPSGETVLSVQSADGRSSQGTLDHSRMVVYIGDSSARGFGNASVPFPLPADANGLWNSLFIRNASAVTAISTTALDGVYGLWSIDGYLEYGGAPVPPAILSVTNVAGGPPGPVAPGEFVSISGSGLVSADAQSGAPVRVSFNGVASPLAYVVGDRIHAVVPWTVAGAADVTVGNGSAGSYPFPLGLTAAAPEVFNRPDGTAQAVAVNQDNSFNSAANPVSKGGYLSFWLSGQGKLRMTGAYATPVLPLQVTLGGVPAEVAFAGMISTGVLQVNIKVPEGAPSGDGVELVVAAGSSASRKPATVAIR